MAAAEQVVTTLTIDARGSAAGSAEYARAMQAAQAAADRAITTSRKAQEAIEKQTTVLAGGSGSVGALARQWDRLAASVDPTVRAEQKRQAALALSNRAVTQLGVSQQEASRIAALATTALTRTTAANDNFAKGLGHANSLLRTFGISLSVAGVVGLAAVAKRSLDAAGGLGELAEQYGITSDALQTYQFGAVQAGVKTEELQSGIARFTKTIGDAREGSAEAVKAVRALGPAFESAVARGASNDELLRIFADRIASIDDKSVAAARGSDLMGRGFQKLMPIFSQGEAGIVGYASELDRLGRRLTPEMIAQADKASDALAKMQFQAGQLGMTLAAGLAPGITVVIEKLNELMTPPGTERIQAAIATLEERVASFREQMAQGGAAGLFGQMIVQTERQIARLRAELEKIQGVDLGAGKASVAAQTAPAAPMAVLGPSKEKIAQDYAKSVEQLAEIDAKVQAEVNDLTNKQTVEDYAKRQKIAEDYSDSVRKLAEEDARVQQEAQEALNKQIAADAEKRDRMVFGPGAQRAAQSYFEGLAEHGTRAGQFVSGAFRSVEDSLAKFLSGGKVKFSDFFSSIKTGLARLAAQDLIGGIGGLLGIGSGGGGSALWSGISSGVSGIGSFISGFFAEGGRPAPGQWAVVGERGPELVKFDRPATVYSNDNSRQMAHHLAAQGEGRDTELVHLMRSEMPILRQVLGPGRLNRRTGLWGFDFGLGGGDPANDDGSTGGYGDQGNAGSPGGFNFGEVTSFDDYGENASGRNASPRGFDRGLDDRVVAALSASGVNVASAVSRGVDPSFFDHLSDFFGVGNPSGFLGSRGLGKVIDVIAAIVGGPLGLLAGFVTQFGRELATGGVARGTGLAGYAYDLTLGERSPKDVFGPQVAAIERAFGPAATSDRIANDNRFNGLDRSAGQVVTDALSLSGPQRAMAFQGGVASGLSGLRAGLTADFIAGPVMAGQSAMARLPGFKDGGEVVIGGSGGADSQLFAARVSPGERVRFTPPGRQQDEALVPLYREMLKLQRGGHALTAEGMERMIGALSSIDARLRKMEGRSQLASAA